MRLYSLFGELDSKPLQERFSLFSVQQWTVITVHFWFCQRISQPHSVSQAVLNRLSSEWFQYELKQLSSILENCSVISFTSCVILFVTQVFKVVFLQIGIIRKNWQNLTVKCQVKRAGVFPSLRWESERKKNQILYFLTFLFESWKWPSCKPISQCGGKFCIPDQNQKKGISFYNPRSD